MNARLFACIFWILIFGLVFIDLDIARHVVAFLALGKAAIHGWEYAQMPDPYASSETRIDD